MGIKEDVKRTLDYGKSEYYQKIREQPSYQTELERTRKDYTPRSWIKSPFALPRFTDKEFDEKRLRFQAKYGTEISAPAAPEVFHYKPRPTITTEEMAAHRWAQKRGLPSPLSPDQLEELARKKESYLNIMRNVSPAWRLNVTSILTAIDNAEDTLVSVAVLGRLAAKLLPKYLGKIVPGLGWVLMGADILSVATTISRMPFAAHKNKRITEELTDLNPFHSKSFAKRASRLDRSYPGFGEVLEIAQTTDQVFGIGVCLGSIMGFWQDALQEGMEQIAKLGVQIVGTIQYPTQWEMIWGDTLKSAGIILDGLGPMMKANYETTLIAIESAAHALMPWWFQNDPLKNVTNLGNYWVRMPQPKNPATIDLLQESGVDPWKELEWPTTQCKRASIQDITLTMAPGIKKNLQTYLLSEKNTYKGMLMGQTATSYYQKFIQSMSDDHDVIIGNTSFAAAAKDMAQQILVIPEGAPPESLEALKNWIRDHERKYGGSPSSKELQIQGEKLGIRWERSLPSKNSKTVEELFPGWRAIQDQIGELFIAD